jgi:hypothetical protein
MNMMNFNQNAMMSVSGMPAPFVPGVQNPFNAGMGDVNGGGMHNPGAIRRGGSRFNNNRSGPYDRNRGVQRGFGTVGGMGMGMSARGPPQMAMGYFAQGGGGGGGKWGDGSGGGMAMGPREAVQGRSIKSYEDLDAQPGAGSAGAAAAAGAGGAELDY